MWPDSRESGAPGRGTTRNNVLSTKHLIEGCWKHRVRRLVFTSSPSVAFDGTDQEKIDETTGYPKKMALPLRPHQGDRRAGRPWKPTVRGKLATCALRPHLIWGPRGPEPHPAAFLSGSSEAAGSDWRRLESGRHGLCRKMRPMPISRPLRRSVSPTSAPAGKAYFYQPGRAGRLLAVDQSALVIGEPSADREKGLVEIRPIGAARSWKPLISFCDSKDEPPLTPIPRAAIGPIALLRHQSRSKRFRLHPDRPRPKRGLKRLKAQSVVENR